MKDTDICIIMYTFIYTIKAYVRERERERQRETERGGGETLSDQNGSGVNDINHHLT